MFNGIVERSLPLLAVQSSPTHSRLTIADAWGDVVHGESIAIDGVCLTVAELIAGAIAFDVIDETLRKTNLGERAAGDHVHVERAMRMGDRISGHLVQGHVDGVARVLWHREGEGEWRVRLAAPRGLAAYLIPKGSVALDGISLTLAAVEGEQFEVALIPTTLQITQLAKRPIRAGCNLECDAMVKTVVNTVQAYLDAGRSSASSAAVNESPDSLIRR